jgi:hypothetical protein
VKIKGTCTSCGRGFMADQVIASGGACPWCGIPFNADYAVTLVDMLREAQEAGSRIERAIDGIANVGPRFTLDESSVTGELKRDLGRLGRPLVASP